MILQRLAGSLFVLIALAACTATATQAPSATPSDSAAPSSGGPEPTLTRSPEPSAVPSETPAGSPAAVPLRTFRLGPGGCDAIGVDNPVYGRLEGSPTASPDPVWLVASDGEHLSVVWPEGFTLRFSPEPELYDATGGVIVEAGDTVRFQVSRSDAAGTYQDPYHASGGIYAGDFPPEAHTDADFAGCFPRAPGT